MEGIELTVDVLQSMKMAKVFHLNKKRIVSLDFDDTGTHPADRMLFTEFTSIHRRILYNGIRR